MKKVNPFFNRYYQNKCDDYYKMLRTNIKYGCKHEGGYSVQSVSYTHLDVYKRQVLKRLPIVVFFQSF